MLLLSRLLFAISVCRFADAIIIPRSVITSTTTTHITTCSCTSVYRSNDQYRTSTLTASSSCTSKNIQPTCKTLTSTIRHLSTQSTTSTSTKPTSTSSPTHSITSSSSSSLAHSTTASSTSTSSHSSTSASSSPTHSSRTSSASPSASAAPVKDSGKRGLAYNDPTLTEPFSLSGQGSKVSWAYNWYSYPYTVGQTQSGYNPALSFVPMLWSTAEDLTSVWPSNVAASVANYGTTAVVAFNEPDGCGGGQACMNVSSAVQGYQKLMDPLAGTVSLGAPAVTNGVGTGIGLSYLSEFIAACTGCHIDFVPIHWYGDAGQTGEFEQYISSAYTAAGNRPIWVTEFEATSGDAQSFLQTVQAWMDGSGMVAKYAWFMDEAGNLINSNGTGMSALGAMYNSG